MSADPRFGLLDRAVRIVADLMNAVGFNGTRLLWKWNRKRQQAGESGRDAENLLRSTRGKHKMCRSCRALVPRSAGSCPECGSSLTDVTGPGLGRTVSNVLPGIKSATSLLFLVNGFWFLLTMMADIETGNSASGGVSLFGGFDPMIMARFGSGASALTLGYGEWWRLITPIFLHWSILHFFFNSYVLLRLGPLAEEEYGMERFWVIYLLCGIGGSFASQFLRLAWFGALTHTAGASGAIFGLIGLLIANAWRVGGSRWTSMKSTMLQFGLYIVIFAFVFPGIDHLNHAGGLAIGTLIGAVVPLPQRGERAGTAWQAAAIGGTLLVLYSFYCVARSM